MPEIILEWGISFVLGLQELGDGFIEIMSFFTFLGIEDFYLLMLPALYWCVDSGLGLRVGVFLLVSSSLNVILKVAFHDPRPYWFNPAVRLWTDGEITFGLPSGHAQNAAAIWGGLAATIQKRWAWITAGILIFLIGISRIYLGVHFPTDVAAGWGIGLLLLVIILALEKPVVRWMRNRNLIQMIGIVFLLSLILIIIFWGVSWSIMGTWEIPSRWVKNALILDPDNPIQPFSFAPIITGSSALFGLIAGAIWLEKHGGFDPGGPFAQRVGRFLVGLLGVIAIWAGLDIIFSSIAPDESLVGYILRFFRYGLVGIWISALGPLVFIKTKLSSRGKMDV